MREDGVGLGSETLEQFAARCGTTAEAIRSPTIDPTEIRAGLEFNMPEDDANGDWLGRARDAVRQAGERVNEAAEAAGRSVSDYLSDQPDLNQDILEFGERLGLPGVHTNESRGAELTVTPASEGADEKLILRTRGRPSNAEVRIAMRVENEEDFRTVNRAQTDRAGALEVTVPVPEEAEKGTKIAFAIETVNGRVRVLSEVFEVGPMR